jgi:hypothetical protein
MKLFDFLIMRILWNGYYTDFSSTILDSTPSDLYWAAHLKYCIDHVPLGMGKPE